MGVLENPQPPLGTLLPSLSCTHTHTPVHRVYVHAYMLSALHTKDLATMRRRSSIAAREAHRQYPCHLVVALSSIRFCFVSRYLASLVVELDARKTTVELAAF